MMMSCDKKFLLKCQLCLFLRLLCCQYLLNLNVYNWGICFFKNHVDLSFSLY